MSVTEIIRLAKCIVEGEYIDDPIHDLLMQEDFPLMAGHFLSDAHKVRNYITDRNGKQILQPTSCIYANFLSGGYDRIYGEVYSKALEPLLEEIRRWKVLTGRENEGVKTPFDTVRLRLKAVPRSLEGET